MKNDELSSLVIEVCKVTEHATDKKKSDVVVLTFQLQQFAVNKYYRSEDIYDDDVLKEQCD